MTATTATTARATGTATIYAELTPAQLSMMQGYDLEAMARRHPLRKVRSFTTRIECGFHEGDSDASWATDDGYVVHRYTDRFGATWYIVRDQAGRWSSQESLDRSRAVIHWLRAQGR